MAAQHVYRDGNQWGVTVPELMEKAVSEGLPLRLRWVDDVTWIPPGDHRTVEIPRITDDAEADNTPPTEGPGVRPHTTTGRVTGPVPAAH